METRLHDVTTSVGLLILRVGIGGYMMTHGWGKVERIIERNFSEFGDPLGIGSGLSLILVAFAEFICAGLVVAGLLTRIAAAPIVFTMGIAAFLVHAADPWTMGAGASKQPALMFMAVFLTLIFTGAGRFSLDAVITRRKSKKKVE